MQDFTKVVQNEGITIIENCEVSPKEIQRVQLINLIEPFVAYGIILAIMWITGLDEDNIFMYIGFSIMLLWILVVSPWWHYEKLNEKNIFLPPERRNLGFWFFEARGLGSIKKYYQKTESGKPGFIHYKKAIFRMLLVWDLAIMCVPYAFENDYQEIIGDFLGGTSFLYQILGMLILLPLVDVVLVFLLFPVLMRLDNFNEGWDTQLRFLVQLGVPLVIVFNLFFQGFYDDFLTLVGTDGAFGMKGDTPFDRLDQFNILDAGGQMAGYFLWGWVQQLLFLSIFSSNFSRAFDLKNNPKQVYTAALLSASFFGLIHLPNFWLSILTWIAGYLWALTFMQCRNLMIMGVSHGMLGTLGNKLLPISYNVGPSSI